MSPNDRFPRDMTELRALLAAIWAAGGRIAGLLNARMRLRAADRLAAHGRSC